MTAPNHGPQHLEQLERLAAGRLLGAEKQEALRHVAECEECRSWTETYRFFADALENERGAAGHPSSEQLASYAVDRGRLSAPELERIQSHLGACLSCRRESGSTADALASAREPERSAVVTPRRLALAAGLLLALAVGWVLQRTPGEPSPASVAAVEEQTVRGESLHGTRVIESTGTLLADAVTVESDGDVTLRAAEGVVFTDGFVVGNGATLRVEISGSDDRDSDTT